MGNTYTILIKVFLIFFYTLIPHRLFNRPNILGCKTNLANTPVYERLASFTRAFRSAIAREHKFYIYGEHRLFYLKIQIVIIIFLFILCNFQLRQQWPNKPGFRIEFPVSTKATELTQNQTRINLERSLPNWLY